MFSNSVIIDTDPGVDDIIALVYAELIKMPILGITTVHGNSNIENVTNNARFIANYITSKPKVYKGSSVSLDGNQYYAESSGKNGLSNYQYASPVDLVESDIDAIEFMRQSLDQASEKIDLLCLGPLTNVAILLNVHPELCQKINRIVAMFGVFDAVGNITPFAEFNAYCDPAAIKSVLATVAENDMKLYVIPANICRKLQINEKELKAIDEALNIPHLRDIVEPYLSYYLTNATYGGFDGAVMYDLLVPLFCENPQIFTFESVNIQIHTDPDEKHGQTTMQRNRKSRISLCTDIDEIAAKNNIMQRFLSASSDR